MRVRGPVADSAVAAYSAYRGTGQRPAAENSAVSNEILDRASAIAGHQFKNPDLLTAALTHASVADSRLLSYERMEFLGDAVLDLIVCEDLYTRYPELLEGELTKIKSVVVSRKVCAKLADQIGLTELLMLGKGMGVSTSAPQSVKAGAFESFVAAVYLDGGIDVARAFILPLVLDDVEQSAMSQDKKNYKSFLQQHAQRFLDGTPRYESLDEKGPDHSKCFEVAVVINAKRFPSAWAPTKKEAEQQAALKALQELNLSPAPQ